MEQEVLQVSFPAEKLEALRFYIQDKGLTVEGELQSYLGQMYEKHIPAPTRRYLDRNDTPEEQGHEQGAAALEDGLPDGQIPEVNAARREKRRLEKVQKAAPEAPVDTTASLEPEVQEAESSGMVMSM